MESEADTPPRSPRSRALWAVPVLLLLMLGADRLWTTWRHAAEPSAVAEWIWIKGTNRWSGPRAFYTWRDFDLEELPGRSYLEILGDEEYVAFLNGERIGSNRYRAGAAPDRYDVTTLLRAGSNRLVVHLRSGSSHGGLLAVLRGDASKAPLVVTDEEWRIARRRVARLMRPELALDRPERAIVVARPPEGRWGSPGPAVLRPLNVEVVLDRLTVDPRRALLPDRGWTDWRSIRRRGRRPLGDHVLFDWEATLTGYLVLFLERQKEEGLGLVYLGTEPPDPARQRPDAPLIVLPGERHWVDAVPRVFRYALVVGLGGLTDARIVRTDPERLPPVSPEAGHAGVFGLEAPRLRTPIENEVWSELEGFAGDAER